MATAPSFPRLYLWHIEYDPQRWLTVNYCPRADDGSVIVEWGGMFTVTAPERLPQPLASTLSTFFELTAGLLPVRKVAFPDGGSIESRPPLMRFSIKKPAPAMRHLQPDKESYRVELTGGSGGGRHTLGTARLGDYSLDAQRLFNDILLSLEAECWKDLAKRTNTEIADPQLLQVFISYRKRPDIEQFAESVAYRLEQERIRARFDKWDMLAGDSLVGKIEEAFAASRACLIVLSNDFTSGKWATSEMQTAIAKRVTEGFRVIPILFEKCPKPQLLIDPIHVDFSDHNPDFFEVRMREVIQGVLGIARRPFGPR